LKTVHYLLLFVFASVLLSIVVHLPPRGDATAPAQRVTNEAGTPVAGAFYIQNAYKDAKTPNMVTVILADYRALDTLGETLVVFAGGLACFFILRRKP
jgi:multicomponent Na+:H+ antiporter subunit B